MRTIKYIGVLFISVGMFGCSNQRASGEETFRDKLKLVTMTGEPVNKDRFEDKVIILNLWATWCGPCIREMPDLEEMQIELPENIVLVLASDEEPERINRFLSNNSFDLEFVRLGNSMESLGVYSLPTTFVIDQNGELAETLVGARKWNTQEQIQAFKNHLQ